MFFFSSADRNTLNRVLSGVLELAKLMKGFAMDLTALKAQVEKNNQVIESAITLINGLADQIRNSANDPAAIQAIADSMNSESEKLAAAIAANTPAAPPS